MTRVHPCWVAIALVSAASGPLAAATGRRERQTDYGIPQVATINQLIQGRWADAKVRPAPPAADGEWCRRVYLDVLGRIPTVDELQKYLRDKRADRKAQLVTRLLDDEAYTADYARNWTTIWTNLLIGRSGGTERNSLTSRDGMRKFLRDGFARNKPYHRMVYELVTATGDSVPGQPSFNGAVNYLAMKVNEERGTLATASTARLFLGLQVQCTQCHNHPFNDWKQQKFWELNAFFRQTRALRRFTQGTNDVRYVTLTNEDFAGEGQDNPSEAASYYELRNGVLRVAYPVFVDGTEVGRSGRVDELNRRDELGRLMLASPYLDRAVINRYWSHFLGYGFTKPIDDLGPHNPPSHPGLLDYLSQEFRAAEYDVKTLIRWIVLSAPYARSSKTNRTSEDPTRGDQPLFSHFYLRQMRAEELYESLLVATKAGATEGSYEERERRKGEWLSQFVRAFGNDEGEESTTFNGSVPQALMMFNGDLIREATSAKPGSFLWEVASDSKLDPRQKIQRLFLAGLSRRPTRDEYEVANMLLAARTQEWANRRQQRRGRQPDTDVTTAALQDIWWAILNSNQFILNH